MKPNIGLNEETRKSVIDILNAELADAHVLYIKTRNYHWNVVGPEFHSLHEIFEKQYTELALDIDEMAERVRALHGRAMGTMGEFLKTARIHEDKPGQVPTATQMLQNLIADREAIIRQMREDIDKVDEECGDTPTADFITGLVEKQEKDTWMLRSFLEGEPVQSGK